MESYISEIIMALFAVIGQIVHIVKKRAEDGNEIGAFRRWVLQRPFNTIAASAAAILAASSVVSDTHTMTQIAGVAFMAGMAANSAINRSGK